MAEYLSRAEMQEMKNQHDGMFTPGSLLYTAALPAIAEFRADAILHGNIKGKNFFAKPALQRHLTPNELKHFSQVPKSGRAYDQMRGGTFNSKMNNRIAQGVRLRQFARGVGMAEVIKIGADMAGGAVDAVMSYRSAPKDIKLSTGPGFFNDTRAAQTQRQRAIQAIHNSQLTTRAALGNEAAFLHI